MQQWEYRFVTAQVVGEYWIPRYEDGKPIPRWRSGPKISDYSNQQGKLGWEMITAAYTYEDEAEGGNYLRLIFKRPKK